MRWGKIVLLFQAVITLIIGITFLSQLTETGIADMTEVISQLSSTNPIEADITLTLDNIKSRYTVAGYVLIIISLIEIILISRLLS